MNEPASPCACTFRRTQGGDTALILAAHAGNFALVEQLLANCTDAAHVHQANHSGETAFDKAVGGFMLYFQHSINTDENTKAIDCGRLCEQYSRIAWAILCKENGLATWLPATQKRTAEPPSSRWKQAQSKVRRSVNRSRKRPSSAPTARRAASRWPGMPTRRPSLEGLITSNLMSTPGKPWLIAEHAGSSPPRGNGSRVHGSHAAGTPHEHVPQLSMTVGQFVQNMQIIKSIIGSGKQTWEHANGFILAMAVAVRESAKASGAQHGLELVDVSADQWSKMVQQHLGGIETRELKEAEDDTVSAPGFTPLAERRVAQSHALKLFELMVELQNHEVRDASTR